MKKWMLIFLSFFLVAASIGCRKKSESIPGQISPGSPEYIMNEGIFYLNEGNIDMAEKKLLKAVDKRPTLIKALNSLGIVYMYKRDFDKAVTYFRKVLTLDSQFIDAYNSLGLIFTEQGKYDLAKENLLIAANSEHYKTPENAFVNLAMLELKYKHYDSAIRYVEKGIKHNRAFAPLYNLRGLILESQNQNEMALHNYQKSLSFLVEPDVNILINMGRTYQKLGDKAKALDTLEKALAQTTDPNLRDQILAMIKEIQEK